jgi:hypothetical protein
LKLGYELRRLDILVADADIYDYTAICVRELFARGPNGSLLVKALCSHMPSVDRMKTEDLFGHVVFNDDNDTSFISRVEEMQTALGVALLSQHLKG